MGGRLRRWLLRQKGVKLDFKAIDALEKSVPLLREKEVIIFSSVRGWLHCGLLFRTGIQKQWAEARPQRLDAAAVRQSVGRHCAWSPANELV